MNATVSANPPVVVAARAPVPWLTVAAFGLLWLELISRLRFEWTINPQYGYGWTVPFLAAYIFWRRSQQAPASSEPRNTVLPWLVALGAAALLIPVRLVQEANPDWRILSWAMALAVV